MMLLERCLLALGILLAAMADSRAGNGMVALGRTTGTWWWIIGIVVIVIIAIALWRRRGRM